jgi:UDP-GlcNAc:undecaprenyl-phosphate/decaprenyl-phosphate GlcNAc-1-phosphate transferase
MEEPISFKRIIKKMPWLVVALLFFWLQIQESAETRMILFAPYLFVIAFLVTFLLVPFMILLGHKSGLLDKPDSNRKIHTEAIPRTGGIAIYLGFISTMILCGHFSYEMKSVLIAGTIIFITGVIDDYRGLSSLIRITIQLGTTLYLIVSGVHITFVPDYFGGIVTESIITLLWIIGITNAMNFIDGMDGLAGGMSVVFSIFFAIISYSTGQYYFMYLALALAGSSLAFLPYNFRNNKPARIFLGDAGSTFIGFTLASSAIIGEWGNSIVDISVPVIILSVLIFDMALTTIVRISNGEVRSFKQWLAYTGRDHVHHRIGMLGLGKRNTVFFYYCIAIGLGLTSLIIVRSNWIVSLIAILQSGILLLVLGIILVKTTSSKIK